MTLFYLGAHHPEWLARAAVPLFVSRRALSRMRTLPRATARWALDSGGFTELQMHGAWRMSAREYATEVRRYQDEIGMLDWAAPQDWMCEPAMLARTGLTVDEHQRRTVDNYLELRALGAPVIPVLQGWCRGEHDRHVELYEAAGVELAALPLVGVGSVCRRQAAVSTGAIFAVLHRAYGLQLHGFGLKLSGLRLSAGDLASADSMAWSFNARRNPPMPGHTHRSCANCMDYALMWREDAITATERRAA